jgi:hypothetical protein
MGGIHRINLGAGVGVGAGKHRKTKSGGSFVSGVGEAGADGTVLKNRIPCLSNSGFWSHLRGHSS